jgi:hypothetical protein
VRKSLAFFGIGLLFLVLFLLAAPQFADRRNAVFKVGNTLLDSEYHQVPIAASGLSALEADYNHGVIVKTVEYMSTFDSNTSVFREIAKIAAGADHECPKLNLVLDLAARSNSDTDRIVALAESACRIQSADDEAAWQAFYDHLSEIAVFPSVEAALAAQVRE